MLIWSGITSGKARRRRPRRRRLTGRRLTGKQLIAPVTVPMALGLALGVVVAQSGGPSRITVSAAGAQATASAAAAHASTADMDCELIVPPNPLTATGLATPYQLTGPGGQDPAASGCTQANPELRAFVQATILNPATGRLWVYEPLVITQGTDPAAAPVRPRLPRNAVVNIMAGFDGSNLQLAGAQPDTLARAKCVDGLDGSLFGQVSYCNSVAFYAAAGRDIAAGKLRIPAAGRSPLTGQPCPTTRSFQLVDQDPGRDHALLDNVILPALGCTAFTAPDLSHAGRPGTSQTLAELSAAASQRAPIALVPENDPMTLVNGELSQPKTNLYRLGVGQPLVIGGTSQPFGDSRAGGQQADTPANFCANLLNIQTSFIAADQARFSRDPSPVPATGNSLFTFLAARLSASFTSLGCGNFGLKNTVTLTRNARGAATAATLSLVPQQPSPPNTPGTPLPSLPPVTVIPLPSAWIPWTPWGNAAAPWDDTTGY